MKVKFATGNLIVMAGAFSLVTSGLAANDGTLDMKQNALCKRPTQVERQGDFKIYAGPHEDGFSAVGFFDLGRAPVNVGESWQARGCLASGGCATSLSNVIAVNSLIAATAGALDTKTYEGNHLRSDPSSGVDSPPSVRVD